SAMVVLVIGVVVPFIALLAAVPIAWGWGLSWLDVTLAAAFYLISGFGVTVGFHRYFTHGAFKAQRWLRVALADRDGDPHSPWRFGPTAAGLAKGLFFAHCGWLFERRSTNRTRFAPDLIA